MSEKLETEEAMSNPVNKKRRILKEYVLPVVLGLILVFVIRHFFIGFYEVPSQSMVPTIQVNDHFVVTKWSYWNEKPQKGDIIVFKFPVVAEQGHKAPDFVKRVIGTPGDRIRIENAVLYVNDVAQKEEYIAPDLPMANFPEYAVGENEYFVMGDNRNHSNDSRFWGTVPESLIVGKARFIYWPISRWGTMENE